MGGLQFLFSPSEKIYRFLRLRFKLPKSTNEYFNCVPIITDIFNTGCRVESTTCVCTVSVCGGGALKKN